MCRNCFHICSSHEIYQRHLDNCLHFEAAEVIMPKNDHKRLSCNNYQTRWFAPVVVYFDLESLLVQVSDESEQFVIGQRTNVLEHHKACGFAIAAIEHGKTKPLHFHLERSETCIVKLLQVFHDLAKDIHYGKRRHTSFFGDRRV